MNECHAYEIGGEGFFILLQSEQKTIENIIFNILICNLWITARHLHRFRIALSVSYVSKNIRWDQQFLIQIDSN